jgi:2-methylisocitrate lyase-like PEP mutase family enzyme
MPTQGEKAARFRELHAGKPFVIPNPWDAGSARMMAALGFEALATTSAGFAFTLGKPDGAVTLEEITDHVSALDAATALPVSVDLENGYGPRPEDAATAIDRTAAAGAVGGSIEDYDPEDRAIYDLEHAVERITAAREAADGLDFPFTLTARAENHFRRNPDLDDTVARLRAYEEAGADVLYAPGLIDTEQIAAICRSTDRPVNVLAHPGFGSLAEIFEAGAQRVSVGSQLTWVALDAAADAAERLRDPASDLGSLAFEAKVSDWLDPRH